MKKNPLEVEKELPPSQTTQRAIELIQSYGTQVLACLIVLLALFIFFYKMSTGTANQSVQDYMNAEAFFQRIAENSGPIPDENNSPFARLMDLLDKHPELHTKYDAAIAQILLASDQVNQSIPITTLLTERAQSEQLRFYKEFTESTLLISQGRYQEALQAGLDLLEKLKENEQLSLTHPEKKAFGPLLMPYQLLRIAMLHQKLDEKEYELEAWEALDLHLEGNEEANSMITNLLSSGSYTLRDYITSRRAALSL